VVHVKAPPPEDVEAAFAVFDEATLPDCAAAVPRHLAGALVKALGAGAQAPGMRAACARCLAAMVVCLSRPAEGGGGDAGGEGEGGSGAAEGALEALLREPGLLPNLYAALKAGNDAAMGPPPPRGAAAAAAGPAAGALAGAGGGGGGGAGGGGAPAEEEAAALAEAAAKCIAALSLVGAADPLFCAQRFMAAGARLGPRAWVHAPRRAQGCGRQKRPRR
jgi:hypothetical protein